MARSKKTPPPDPNQLHSGLEISTETLLLELAARKRVVNQRASARGTASQALKEAQEAYNATLEMLVQKGIDLTAQPALPLSVDGHEDDRDDDELDREEEVAAGVEPPAVLSGTTGAPITMTRTSGRALAYVPGEKYPRHESEERPGECECGYSMTGLVVGHDDRHERYLLERDRERMIDVVEAPREKVAAKRGPRDMTAAVAKRSKKTSAKKPPAKKKAAKKKAARR